MPIFTSESLKYSDFYRPVCVGDALGSVAFKSGGFAILTAKSEFEEVLLQNAEIILS